MRDGLGSRLQRTRTGGHDLSSNGRSLPLFELKEAQQIIEAITTTEPKAHGLPGSGWTLKKVRQWVSTQLNRVVSRSALHTMLQKARLSWKKCKKLLGKRNPQKREAFMKRLLSTYEKVRRHETVVIYVDESHFHRDVEIGYTWGRIGERIWHASDCPPLAERINWFGAYNFTDGQCMIWAEGACNQESTTQFLHRVDQWVQKQGRQLIVIWDGAPWHRAQSVQQAAQELNIELMALPGYSPDLNPIEGLWKWMREEVTQLCCYPNLKALFDACKDFIENINKNALHLINRLWPRFELKPEEEKLVFST
jgi:transposase